MKNKLVMLNSFQHLIITILCWALICIGLTSCENFMNGAETKEKLEQLVKEANAPKVQVYLKADDNTGTLSPNGLYECKLDTSFPILFDIAPGYKFIRWEVVDRNTGNPLPGAVVFEDETKPETRVTVKQNIQNIKIQPVYATYPCIVSTSPVYNENGVYANMPVEIKFNIPMINDDGSVFPFSFENISIFCDGEIINRYFYEPELINNNQTVKILPKAIELQNFILSKKTRSVIIQVTVNGKMISLVQNGLECPFFDKDNSTFTYKALNEIENDIPTIPDCYVSKQEITMENWNAIPADKKIPQETETVTEFNDIDVVKKHWVSKTIHIYGKLHDSGSGVKTVLVRENSLYDKNGDSVGGVKDISFEKEDLHIIRDDGQTIEFFLDYEFKSIDGCIKLTLFAVDYCDHFSDGVTYMIIKDTDFNLGNVFVYNLPYKTLGYETSTCFDIDPTKLEDGIDYVKIYIDSDLKTQVGNAHSGNSWQSCYNDWHRFNQEFDGKRIYSSFKIPPEELSIECEYDSKVGHVKLPFTLMEEEVTHTKYLGVKLNVDSVAKLKFKVHFTDPIGNHTVLECQFPGYVDKVKKIETDSLGYKVYFDTDTPWQAARTFTTDDSYKPMDFTGDAELFYSDYYTYPLNGYFIHRDGFNQDIMLINKGDNYKLYGPLHEVFISNTVQISNQIVDLAASENQDIVKPLPKACTYTKGELNSNHVFVNFEFDDSVWDYWDEITFNATPSSSYGSGPLMTIKKGTKLYTYEDTNSNKYHNEYENGRSMTMTGYKLFSVEKNDDGDIVSISTITSKPVSYTAPLIPDSCYTYPPQLSVYNQAFPRKRFYTSPATNSDQLLSPSDDMNKYFCPLSIKSDIEIKTIKYQTKDMKTYTNNYHPIYSNNYKVYSNSTSNVTRNMYFYPLDGFFELGSVLFTVEDVNGNVSTVSISQLNTLPYVKKLTKDYIEYSDSSVSSEYLYPLTFENGEWVENISLEAYYTNKSNHGKSFPRDKFIKILAGCYSSSDKYCSRSSYFYIPSDDATTTGNGSMCDDNRGIRIKSDTDVFVHTVITSCPLETCEFWSVDDWENFHRVTDEKVISFTATDNNWKKIIPDTTDLNSGDNYVVIAYFADGTNDMSAVRHFE